MLAKLWRWFAKLSGERVICDKIGMCECEHECANESMRVKEMYKTKENNQLYVIACVYVYMCMYARQCVEICVTRESNFVRFLSIRQNFYINYLLHRVFITYIIFILMTLWLILLLMLISLLLLLRYAYCSFFSIVDCTKAEDAV